MQGRLSRRGVVAGGVAAGLVAAPFVRSAYAAGTITIGLWDHWVPGANDVTSAIIKEWADKEKVDVKVDYITSQGNKLLLTLAAEAQAKSGHDIMEFTNWEPAQTNSALEPVDDVVKQVLATNGPIDPAVEYLGKFEGHWLGVPMTRGTLLLGCCTRFDMMKEHGGVDVQALYPAGKPPNDASWTWDAFLAAAEKCQKAGVGFGLPLGSTTDTNQWVGALFLAYGAELMDAKGNVTVKSDSVKQVLEYGKKLVAFCPADATAWDDASNNKWLISGKGALIFNPPSAWAVAKRDAPQVAEKCWTHGFPEGAGGPVQPDPAALLWCLELLQEQAGGQEPARVPDLAAERREAGGGEPGLRHPALHQVQRLQDLGRGGAAQGLDLALSDQGRRPEGRRRLLAGAAADRGPDLGAVDPGPDARPLRQGRGDGQDHGLGRARGRRLQADLRSGLLASDLPRAAPFVRRSSRPTLRP